MMVVMEFLCARRVLGEPATCEPLRRRKRERDGIGNGEKMRSGEKGMEGKGRNGEGRQRQGQGRNGETNTTVRVCREERNRFPPVRGQRRPRPWIEAPPGKNVGSYRVKV
ncbi:MAG: hypothetical protein SOI66_02710 [Bifidobacterium sp.]|jgi:hypothetical protein